MEGKYLQVRPEDYVKDVSAAQDKSLCKVHIRPLDAPFNILGLPIYMDYYVTHGNDTMTFAPHQLSLKSKIESAPIPVKMLAPSLEFENTANGDTWAFVISFFLTLCGIGLVGVFVGIEYTNYQAGTQTITYVVGIALAGIVVVVLGFFVIQWILLAILMPGNRGYDVEDPDTAIAKVYNSRLGLVGMVGVIAAFFGKK